MLLARVLLIAGTFSLASSAVGQAPSSRFRPLGAPSAVDQFRQSPTLHETAHQLAPAAGNVLLQPAPNASQAALQQEAVQQVAMWQQGGFQFPTGGAESQIAPTQVPPPSAPSLPTGPTVSPPASTSGQSIVAPRGLPPRGLPSAPANLPSGLPPAPVQPQVAPASPSDYAPIAQPQLNDYATLDNCNCISPPSGYTAVMAGCATPVAYAAPTQQQPYVPPPNEIAAPVVLPPAGATVVAPAATVAPPTIPTYDGRLRSLVSFGQDRKPVQIGQGIVGQPVAYVPGQRFRNFLRYLFP